MAIAVMRYAAAQTGARLLIAPVREAVDVFFSSWQAPGIIEAYPFEIGDDGEMLSVQFEECNSVMLRYLEGPRTQSWLLEFDSQDDWLGPVVRSRRGFYIQGLPLVPGLGRETFRSVGDVVDRLIEGQTAGNAGGVVLDAARGALHVRADIPTDSDPFDPHPQQGQVQDRVLWLTEIERLGLPLFGE